MPKTDQKIDLNTMVSSGNWPLFRHGLEYFSWIKSKRRHRYYLLCGKKIEYGLRVAAVSPVILIIGGVSIVHWPGFQTWLLAAVMIAVNLAALLACWGFLRRTAKYLKQLPASPIAVIDRDQGLFYVRNPYRLPFIQTGMRRYVIPIGEIHNFVELRAFKVTNGGQNVCDPCSRTPTFGALYVCRVPGDQAPQMLFADSRIPYRITQFIFNELKIPVEDLVNRQILD